METALHPRLPAPRDQTRPTENYKLPQMFRQSHYVDENPMINLRLELSVEEKNIIMKPFNKYIYDDNLEVTPRPSSMNLIPLI